MTESQKNKSDTIAKSSISHIITRDLDEKGYCDLRQFVVKKTIMSSISPKARLVVSTITSCGVAKIKDDFLVKDGVTVPSNSSSIAISSSPKLLPNNHNPYSLSNNNL